MFLSSAQLLLILETASFELQINGFTFQIREKKKPCEGKKLL